MKVYNLCDPKEYDLVVNDFNNKYFFSSFSYYQKYYEYYYANIDGFIHRLDGPAYKCINGPFLFFVHGKILEEEAYWNHPDVIAFKYLKEHPELEAFV